MLPIQPAKKKLFNPQHVNFLDDPGTVTISETDQNGAVNIKFDVAAPSITVHGKSGGNIYWLSNQRCADGAIIVFETNGIHVHLVELKQTISVKSWEHIKTQFSGMLANVHAVLGTIQQSIPRSVTCHVAYANNNLAASPVLSKVINTKAGLQALSGSDWSIGRIAILDVQGIRVNKILWGSAPVSVGGV